MMLSRVVMMMHVGRREVLELVMVVRVMGSHSRGATVISGHHFCDICSSCATESHSPPLTLLLSLTASQSEAKGYQATKLFKLPDSTYKSGLRSERSSSSYFQSAGTQTTAVSLFIITPTRI